MKRLPMIGGINAEIKYATGRPTGFLERYAKKAQTASVSGNTAKTTDKIILIGRYIVNIYHKQVRVLDILYNYLKILNIKTPLFPS